jgi:hypothetical protein
MIRNIKELNRMSEERDRKSGERFSEIRESLIEILKGLQVMEHGRN